ncbi:hypothetical protein CH371_10825 [Leptospira wolffii]|uniref:Uncharacterized protein n=1 Tax=Leptospira wolffii TaxID=409998 RepID=A0A2M9ZCE8_9LEPT|nr:hypothetical protein CH371_10825 [Leptospira wolffii]
MALLFEDQDSPGLFLIGRFPRLLGLKDAVHIYSKSPLKGIRTEYLMIPCIPLVDLSCRKKPEKLPLLTPFLLADLPQ